MKTFISMLFYICFTLLGCSNNEMKGEFDLKGRILEITPSSILIDDALTGEVWLELPDNMNKVRFQEGQQVVVWVEGEIDTSAPQSAKVLNIEIISPSP